MKNYLIISLLILSVGFSQREYNHNDLIEMDNGLWTVKFNDESITGKVYGGFGVSRPYKKVYMGEIRYGKQEGRWKYYYHSTGKKEFDFNFKNGKRYGLNTEWYENGQKRGERTYKDDKKDGLWIEWYENGQKNVEGTFKDGIKDGLWIGWFENGQKRGERNYKDGKSDGLWIGWFENGQKENEVTYKYGEIVEVIGMWNKNGSVKW